MLWLVIIQFILAGLALFNIVGASILWSTGELMRSDKIILLYLWLVSFLTLVGCTLAGFEIGWGLERVQEWLETWKN